MYHQPIICNCFERNHSHTPTSTAITYASTTYTSTSTKYVYINNVYVYFYHAYVFINHVYVYFYLVYVYINHVYVYTYYIYTVKRENCKKQPAVTTILESLTTQSQICYAAERQNTQHQQPRDKESALKLLAEACC